MEDSLFIVRVYGIFINSSEGLLVSDEYYSGKHFTKFPGGGLEYGEGTLDCLSREMKEETGVDFEVNEHFYTTDFFVESIFHDKKQILSIYYWIMCKDPSLIKLSAVVSDNNDKGKTQSLRYIPLIDLSEENFTFPIDRHVAGLLMKDDRIISHG